MTTILIVEDDVDNQDLYRRYLQHRAYEVLQAWDGESGILMAQEHQPDLIIMDVRMPGMNGLDATRSLKADPATSGIPILILSAHARIEDADAATGAGCDAFLTKPAIPKEVASVVQRLTGF